MAHATSKDPNVFLLPDLGEGLAEAELIKWRVEVGQTVKELEVLAEMETDKALVEVTSPRAGTISGLHGQPGEILKVGLPFVTYSGGAVAETKPTPQAKHETKHDHKHESKPVATSNGHDDQERPDEGTVVGDMSGGLAGITASNGKALATPAVRRLARDLGVEIDSIAGSGIGGRVLEKDVRAAVGRGGREKSARGVHDVSSINSARPMGSGGSMSAAGLSSTPATVRTSASPTPPKREAASIPPGQESVRIPFRGVRRTIANRLRQSVNQAVHFNVMDEADVSALDGLRKKLGAASGEKISFLPFVASAVCRVLSQAEFRALNSTVDEKPDDESADAFIIQHRAVHLGIATDTESGLMVPVIRDCDALGVLEIGRHIADIAAQARSRSIARENLMGSTFTISNVGSHAGRFATPIINYPEAAILAVGRGRQAPVIRSSSGGPAFAIGNLLPLSLACDHRVVDGATAALALAKIIELLQDPEQLLGPARG
jgi:pyruvate dehydrogenase E2 component (dihydrolipoamide acetyltransferase)